MSGNGEGEATSRLSRFRMVSVYLNTEQDVANAIEIARAKYDRMIRNSKEDVKR
ncbi:hypothetical protein [Cohnella xylanilytica]|uniref:hypothetical protein n=1 Tax=Cohnella xylanilytica TaxID=557555 RepID=UPI001BB34A04|nr:hypothetical protein [Cohnella xylanilytica]